MRVLVTGGAGYIGSTTVPLLLAQGHEVRVVDLAFPRDSGPAAYPFVLGHLGLAGVVGHPRLEVVRGDILDAPLMDALLHEVDCVVHLAAVVGTPACEQDPAQAYAVNVGATRALLAARRLGQRVVLASTSSVYGHVPAGVCDEQTPAAPLSLYAETKAEAERLVLAAGGASVLRLATAWGAAPITRLDLLPNELTALALTQGTLTVYEPAARRCFLHVADIARAFVFAVEHPEYFDNTVLNVGDRLQNMTKLELADAIAAQTGAQVNPNGVGADPDRRDYELSFARIAALGFHATVGLKDGLVELVRVLSSTGVGPSMPRRRIAPHPAALSNTASAGAAFSGAVLAS